MKKIKEDKENIYAIIPLPLSIKRMFGNFAFTTKSQIILSEINDETKSVANFLAKLIYNAIEFSIPIIQGDQGKNDSVFMKIDTSITNNEGYILTISYEKIIIKAKTPVGFFYAIQTLRQLFPKNVENNSINTTTLLLPLCEIIDEPRFGYRGMHLDVSRHMFPVKYIKRYIDMIALHKMNIFHWHLTDDQGWRIEIKKYPKLTEIGAFRKGTVFGHVTKRPHYFDKTAYGGFYSQEEIKEIVLYAKSQFVTIIPEIEMPGHSLSALATYPELSCSKGPFEVSQTWGITDNVFCAGKEGTFKFIKDVLSEVIELFPSKYIHIGGDECLKSQWKICPLCQKRIKDENLKDEKELQSYFIKRIEKFLISKDKSLIGWDEILEGGLAPEATVMSWRGINGGIEAAKQGHDVIMTPNTYVYFDYYQDDPYMEPLAIGGYLPLEKVYSFNPQFIDLNNEEQKHILGVQGNVWTEYMPTPEQMEYMAYPRMFAIAEVGWTCTSKKDFEDFLFRFSVQRIRYDIIGINYFKGNFFWQ